MEQTKQKRRYTKTPKYVGRPKVETSNQKIKVWGYVKRQHFLEVQSLITELIQPYR